MAINFPLWFVGSVFFIAGVIGLFLTHFGIVYGFRWITPMIWGVGAGFYWASLPVPHPAISFPIIWFLVFAIALAAIYYNWLGLGSVI